MRTFFISLFLVSIFSLETKAQDFRFTVKGVTYKMVAVQGGTFSMKDASESAEEDGSNTYHKVTVKSFYIGETEVTQELWEAVMGSNPSQYKNPDYPVEYVSWDDCQKFIAKLNTITGKRFRLPTEAEWEYAARGGNRSNGYEYSGSNRLADVGLYDESEGLIFRFWTETDVKTFQPNELGIYDMSGNVDEWCHDLYIDNSSSFDHPEYTYRILRGGNWGSSSYECRIANSGCAKNFIRSPYVGLRLAY